MNILKCLITVFTILLAGSVSAQTDLTGTWEGDLVVGPDQEIVVQFIFERAADGGYTAVLNAPDQPSLRNIPVDTLTVDQNGLTMNVNSVSGVYEGTIGDGAIQGTWSQQGTAFDLNLAPYTEPVLTPETFALLDGSWVGELRPIPGGEMVLNVILRFEESAPGEYEAFFSVPDQGASNIPVSRIVFDGEELTVALDQPPVQISGNVSGENFTGNFTQGGQSLDLNMEKGEFELEGLDISPEAFASIEGPWHGQVGPLNIVFRFEEEDGKYLAFLDSPDQGAADIPVTTLSVQGNQLNLTIAPAQASLFAVISTDQMSGTWSQGGQDQTVTLVRGRYVPNADLSAETIQQLAGTWQGEVNNTALSFRFEPGDNDGMSAFLDIPSMGANGLPVTNIALQGTQFSFSVGGIGAGFSGAFTGSEINGEWTRAGATNPLMLSKQ
ncbi:MAG: hypothetical protein WDZ76_05860 [Pseudohongiellaceae bacterium]